VSVANERTWSMSVQHCTKLHTAPYQIVRATITRLQKYIDSQSSS
jgi:hypothetical protein